MQMHEDLATLFSRNLSLHNAPYQKPVASSPIHQTTQPEEAITYSITQHYHHSAHLASQQLPRPSSTPPPTDQETLEIILGRHGVDVSTLFPSQIELFRSAEPSQQMRLVELWRISPPNLGGHALSQNIGSLSSVQTTFEHEEAMARMRYERQTQFSEQQLPQVDGPEDMMSDGEQSNAPLTPIQGGDGRWAGTTHSTHQPEPYMASGYESLAAREYELSAQRPSKDVYSHFGTAVGGLAYSSATDPVYKSIADIQQYPNGSYGWAQRSLEEQQRAMEDQYGAFSEHRYGSGDMVKGYGGEDEEML
jgi:hypothetical protein